MAHRVGSELGREETRKLAHPLLLLLPRDAEIADAHVARLRHLPLRPDTAVLAGEHVEQHTVAEVDRLAAGDADHPIGRDPRSLQHPHRLVAADHGGRRVRRDPLRAPQMVEVRVTDDDPVALVDVVGGEAGTCRAGRAVDVGVEEDREPCDGQPEGRTAVPIERRGHARNVPGAERREPEKHL